MSARPRYCPSLQIPTAQLVVERGLGTCKPEESPGVKWKNNVTQETLTLEEVSPDGDLSTSRNGQESFSGVVTLRRYFHRV